MKKKLLLLAFVCSHSRLIFYPPESIRQRAQQYCYEGKVFHSKINEIESVAVHVNRYLALEKKIFAV